MGDNKDKLDFVEKVYDDYVILIPAGKWHNLINTGINHLNCTLFMRHLNIHVVQFIKLKKMQRSITGINETRGQVTCHLVSL
jgi:hypothetical protein